MKSCYCTYVGSGSRSFGDAPIVPYTRISWEFYAVIQGRIAFSTHEGQEVTLQENTLWLFPPEHLHGWIGEPNGNAQVAVFHFDQVLPELQALTKPQGHAEFALSEPERNRLLQAAKEMLPSFWEASPLLKFHSMRTLMDLSLLILEKPNPPGESECPEQPASKVKAAENWFRSHVWDRPTLARVAKEAGTTEGHLRRLFHAERGYCPKTMMSKIQLARAEELLARTDLKLEAVASESGFANASYLCKVFKQIHGTTPAAYREVHRSES